MGTFSDCVYRLRGQSGSLPLAKALRPQYDSFTMGPQVYIAVGAVIAAFIAALSAFLGIVISKENKTSELRQAWIDSLREDISIFVAYGRRLATHYKIKIHGLIQPRPSSTENVDENRLTLSEKYYAIKLRLNPNEQDHQQLAMQLDEVYAIAESEDRTEKQLEDIEIACDSAVAQAQTILKKEWERVKRGEPIFLATRRIALLSIFIIVTGAFFLFLFGLYKWLG